MASSNDVSTGSARAIKRQVEKLLEEVREEADELSYLIDKIDTNVSFIASQVADAIEKWKQGVAYKGMSLQELNYHFRLQTCAVESGWDLWHFCPDWLRKTRKRVRVLLGFLGAEVGEDGDFLKAISDLEQGQRVKGLQINIEVVECLNMLRDVVQITADMEIRLEDLRKVCEKRSNQIIAPVWEPRGVI